MEEKLLEKMGLTPGEIKVYLALLETGPTTTGAIVSRTGLQKSAVYFCLERLVEKGVVSYVIKNNRKYFEAAYPDRLLDFLEEKKRAIDRQKKELSKALPRLRALMKMGEKKLEARVYEGWKGVETAFLDAYKNTKPGEECFCFTLSSRYGGANPERLRRLITRVRRERVRRRLRLKVLSTKDSIIGQDQAKTPFTTVRFVKGAEANPAVFNIYGENVLIVLWKKVPVAFFVRSKELAATFKLYFDALWKAQ